MLLAWCKRHPCIRTTSLCVLVLAVDYDIVTSGRGTALATVESAITSLIGSDVVPIHDRERAQVDIIISTRRAVNDHRSDNAVTVLAAEVGVIPGSSVFGGLKQVGLCISRGEGACI